MNVVITAMVSWFVGSTAVALVVGRSLALRPLSARTATVASK